MPTTQQPTFLWDNILDYITLYNAATIISSGDAAGHPSTIVSSWRRDRQFWTPYSDAGMVWTGSLITNGSTPAGSSTISLTATTLTGSLAIGDTFVISAVTYTVTAPSVAAANVILANVSPVTGGIIAASTAVTGYSGPTGNWVGVDSGSGNTVNINSVFLDRSHNLAGKTLLIEYSDNSSTWTNWASLVVPAAGVTGQDPTAGFSQTEEGACYYFGTAAGAAHRYWRARIAYSVGFLAQIYGLVLGTRQQLPYFSATLQEDDGTRSKLSDVAITGWTATAKTYAWRTITISFTNIDSTTYDTQLRGFRQPLFALNCPVFIVTNYGIYPARGWVYQYEGNNYSAPSKFVHRDLNLTFRELYQVIS